MPGEGADRPAEAPLKYDPLFETPPDTVIRDTPGRGFFGKAAVKKTLFVLVLSLFVGVSIALSFTSLKKDRFRYTETEEGIELDEYIAGKTDAVLEIGPVFDREGAPEPGKTVTAVREFAICCDEYTAFIFIGPEVREIPDTAFYGCAALQAVLVDAENPCFRSVDGVLYRQENGAPTELMLYPRRNDLYRAALALGEAAPRTADEAAAFAAVTAALDEKSRADAPAEKNRSWRDAQEDGYPAEGAFPLTAAEQAALLGGLSYRIEPGVTRIGEMAFAECDTLFEVAIPDGVREIASMSFFKCGELRGLTLPASAETIGSDAFSYCEKLPEIVRHHAFYGCDGVDEVRLLCGEEDAPETGQDWLPKKRKLFEHNVPVVYGAEDGGIKEDAE